MFFSPPPAPAPAPAPSPRPPALSHVLIHTTSPEVTESALEVARASAADPALALHLVSSESGLLFRVLLDRVSAGGRWGRSPEDFGAQRREACNLLAVIMSHEAALARLREQVCFLKKKKKSQKIAKKSQKKHDDNLRAFSPPSPKSGGDNVRLLEPFVGWLEEDEDGDGEEDDLLLVTGALAVGNAARDEDSCAGMVDDGTSDKLIGMLRRRCRPSRGCQVRKSERKK